MAQSVHVWDGTGADGDWQRESNWEGFFGAPNARYTNDLVFKGTERLTTNNDYRRDTWTHRTSSGALVEYDFAVGDLIFDATAGEFRLKGNDLSLVGDITNKSSSEQNIDLNIFLENSSTWKNTKSSGYLDINGQVDIGDGYNLTIDGGDIGFDGGIVGGGGLIKTGDGILSLDGTNTYSGGTDILGGTVRLEGGDNLSGRVTISSGAKLDLNETDELVSRLKNSGEVDLSGGAKLLFSSGLGDGEFYGSGALHITEVDAEYLSDRQNDLGLTDIQFEEARLQLSNTIVRLTGNNTYSGGTTVDARAILAGTTTGIQGDINNQGLVAFDQDFTGEIGGKLVDEALGVWKFRGGGQFNLLDTSELYGDIYVSEASTLGLESDLDLGEVYLDDSTLQVRESLQSSKRIEISNAATIDVLSGQTLVQSARVEGPQLTKKGDGVLELRATVGSYLDISVDEGTLIANSFGSSVLGGSNKVHIAKGATYDMENRRGTVGSLTGSGDVSNISYLSVQEKGNSVFAGDITSGSNEGFFTKSGSGSVTLTGTGSSFAATNLYSGRLNVSNASSLGSDEVSFGQDTVLGIQESFDSSFSELKLTRLNSTIEVGSGKEFSMVAGIKNASTSYVRTLNKTGEGTLRLDGGATGNNVNLRVREGTVEVGSGGGITGVRGLEILSGARLDATGAAFYAGDLLNQGRVSGGEGLNLSGNVTGAGSFDGSVSFGGIYGPGNSPALVEHGVSNFLTSSTLSMELGGNTRGSEYDALNGLGFLLDGILAISLIDIGSGAFVPELGASFDLLRADTISGMFSTIDFSNALLGAGLVWAWDIYEDAGDDIFRLSVNSTGASVPEPGMLSLLALGLIILFRGSSYNIARPKRSLDKEGVQMESGLPS